MKIYVHGNCQAPALADLIAVAGGGSIEVASLQAYSLDLEADRLTYLDLVTTSDVIITQPVSDLYRGVDWLSPKWIKTNARPDARVLVFPVVYHRGQIPQCFTLEGFHNGRLAYHDAHALDYFLRGESADAFIEDTSRSDFLPDSFVLSELSRTMLELLRREHSAAADVSVSDIIASRLTTSQPLYTVNHPSKAVMGELAERVMRLIGRSEAIEYGGVDMLDRFIMPPYISSALALGCSGEGLWLDDMRFDGQTEKRWDFFSAVFEEYAEIGSATLRAAVAQSGDISGYLDRYRAAGRLAPPHEDNRRLVNALYSTFLGRRGTSDEIVHHLQTLRREGFDRMVETFPRSSEFAAVGGGAVLQERFATQDSMPVIRELHRIPHPDIVARQRGGDPSSSESPTTGLQALTARISQAAGKLARRLAADRRHAPEASASGGAAPTLEIEATGAAEPSGEGEAGMAGSGALPVLTIVVPMAGRGSRFADSGYSLPKPLISVGDQPMIKVVIDNLRPARPHRFVFICQTDHIERYGLEQKLRSWAPSCEIVGLDGVTEGAACTVLAARAHIGSGPLMIANSDQFVEVDMEAYLDTMSGDLDGLIMTMQASDPKWSFAEIGADNLVRRVVEKEVVSEEATVGVYNFADGMDFVRGAEAMITRNERVNGEFYVAPVYNELIARGAKIAYMNVGSVSHGMYGLGTPEDLEVFLDAKVRPFADASA